MPKAYSILSSMYGWRPEPPAKKETDVKDGLRLEGQIQFRHFRNGTIVDTRRIKNQITNTGVAAVAGLLIQTGSTDAFDFIGLGTGTQGAASTDTALETELSTGGAARSLATLSRVTTTLTNDTAQLVHTFTITSTSTLDITEAGTFSSSSSGAPMLSRQVFTPISVVSADTLEVTWKIKVAVA